MSLGDASGGVLGCREGGGKWGAILAVSGRGGIGGEGEVSGAPAVCLSSPSGDLAGRGWACRLLPAASDVIRSEVKPFGVWCNWQHD